jgi:hypothetical protein
MPSMKGRCAPAIYRFICPDRRSYVVSAGNHHNRSKYGLGRSNPWINEALLTYPSETWTFEVLEQLSPGCSNEMLRHAEQRHIERLRSWMPEHGFNILPAAWKGDTPAILAGRKRLAVQTRSNAPRRARARFDHHKMVRLLKSAIAAGQNVHGIKFNSNTGKIIVLVGKNGGDGIGENSITWFEDEAAEHDAKAAELAKPSP